MAINFIDVNVEISLPNIEQYVYDKLINDKATLTECNQTLRKFCDKYVPYLNGPMSQTNVVVDEDGVEYFAQYANRQYYLHDMDADLAGETNRTRTVHPLATSYWDRAMMLREGDNFAVALQQIFDKRAKEINNE